MTCRKCGSHNITVQAVSVQKKRGIIGSLMWILFAIMTCGLTLIIPILTKKGSKVKKYAICQDCGHKWRA